MVENLTEKQKKFCEEYIIDFNATQACVRSGYSEKTANRIGTENLSKLVIQSYIQELIKKREQRTEITADMVVKELAKVTGGNGGGRPDFAQAGGKEGKLVPEALEMAKKILSEKL